MLLLVNVTAVDNLQLELLVLVRPHDLARHKHLVAVCTCFLVLEKAFEAATALAPGGLTG
jgi:hypothetical protein